jgi:cytidylate kinase
MAEVKAPSTIVVAISRQLGSGGSYIGQAVARRLNFKYVDRQILERAAEMLGMPRDDLAQLEERVSSRWVRLARILSLGPPDGPYSPPRLPVVQEEEIFEVENRIIQEIAEREDAVIVGRGSFYMLRHHPAAIRVFVYAPVAWRARRLMATFPRLDEAAAHDTIVQADERRARFVETMTGGPWTEATRYDLCLNTATLGLDQAAELVASLVSARLKERESRKG